MSRDKIYEGHATVHLNAPRQRVWEWLSSPDSALYWHPDCVDAHRLPTTPEGVGAMHVLVSQRNDTITRTTYEVSTLIEPAAIEFRDVGTAGSSIHIDLTEEGGGTLATLKVRAKFPKKSFQRWQEPTPHLIRSAASTLERIQRSFP